MTVNRRTFELLSCWLAVGLSLTACEPLAELPLEPEPVDDRTVAAPGDWSADARPDRSITAVLSFATMTEVGTSTLLRRRNGVSYNLRATQLEPGTATTMWLVVFNRPAACAGTPCMEPDLLNPATEADVMYAAGHVIGGSGRATFAGSRRIGDASGSIFAPLGLPAPGIRDLENAEIHFVVRSHGPKIPALLPDMIHTFNGGCQPPGAPFPDPVPPEYGAPGPNTCVDVQFAVHQP
ncbi:MAG: hypothetical protein ACRELD_13060 [Longimicrobiales bacterium]